MEQAMQIRINEMIDAVMSVAQGDYSVQVKVSDQNDDLDSLAMGLNMMVEDIKNGVEKEKAFAAALAVSEAEKKRAQELHALNQQIRASEQQLKAANQQLKAKEQALMGKMADLERINKLMIGRELDMIELKKKINALLEELGRPKEFSAV